MAVLKSSSWNSRQLVPVLVGLTLVYQLVYNAILFGAVERDAIADDCATSAVLAGTQSAYCQEVQVFQSWHEADVRGAGDDRLLAEEAVGVLQVHNRTSPEKETQAPIQVDTFKRHPFGRQTPWRPHSHTQVAETQLLDVTTKAVHPTPASTAPTKSHFRSVAGAGEGIHVAHRAWHRHTRLWNTTYEKTLEMAVKWANNMSVETSDASKSATPSSNTFLEKRLQWSSVTAWPKYSQHFIVSESTKTVSRSQVRHMHWAGVVPKVACITPIVGSRHARARMMYFIDNFRLQDYEGPRQLVLVYHHLDINAAELVQSHADGAYIKGVVAHGDDAFPSTAGLRYGAWSSDADIIARWEFDEWHDPSQLSIQIRALAMVSRPACVLKPNAEGNEHNGSKVVLGSSLVGERSWMKMHWHPYLEEEAAVLETSQVDHIVQLDMQNSGLVGAIQNANLTSETPRKTKTDSQHDWSMSECLDFENSSKWSDAYHILEETIGEKVGGEMGATFHKLLTKHHDVTRKLRLLCLETTLEREPHKHEFMRKHVAQMAAIRAELDNHISALKSIFNVST